MKWIVLVALVLWASGARAQLPIPGFQKTRQDRQREAAGRWAPKAIELRPTGAATPSETRTIRMRVWAARDYRRGTFEWASRFRRVVERVDGVAGRWPNVRFEIVEMKPWERDSTDLSLERLLDELEHADAGGDVDLVIGLVAAMPVVPTQIHNLGMARQGGRHVVIRSLHELTEYQAAQEVFDELQPSERERVVAARKTHKEQVVFLHEWGHTLGLLHTVRAWSIMNPEYSEEMSRFSETDGKMIELALARPDGWTEKLRAIVQAGDPDWNPREREAWLRRGERAAEAPAPSRTTRAAPADVAVLNQAIEAARAGRIDAAWELVSTVEKKYPRDPEVRILVCQLAAARPDDAARTALVEASCRQALELAPRDPRPVLGLGEAYLHDDARALAQAVRADELLSAQPDAAPAEWGQLAVQYSRRMLPSLAARAAARADPATRAQIDPWVARVRHRYVFPAGLAPSSERVWVDAVEAGRAHPAMLPSLAGGSADRALLTALVRCEIDARAGRASARAACATVLAGHEDASRAHLGMGLLMLKGAQAAPAIASAIASLRRAIELDSDEESAWQALAWLYKAQHRGAEAAALEREHEAIRRAR